MNAPTTILLAAGSALAVAVGAQLFAGQRSEAQEPADGLALQVSELAAAVDGLRAEQERSAAELAKLRMAPPAGNDERYAVGEIEAAIERYLAERPLGLDASPASAVMALADDFAATSVRSLIEGLTDDSQEWIEREELWQKIRSAGRLDEVIAEFERMALNDPMNPDRQVELGWAYIEKIQEVGGALAGKWATKADEQFDKALALDEEHWQARYMKAVSLSHWPAFTGKTGEAIAQLEKLIEIQTLSSPEPHHVESYLTLGNIYLGQGKEDLALETWQAGLALFPGHEGLAGQIDSLSK